MNKIGREIKRKIRVRSKVKGTCARPRLSVYRSNKFIYAQLINDDKHKQLSILEVKIDRLLTKQDELMQEIKLLRFENKQLKEKQNA